MPGVLAFGGSLISGALLGWLFARLWRRAAPRATNRRFWLSLGEIARRLLVVEDLPTLLALYRRLALEAGAYVIRNLGGLVLGCLPVAAFLILVAPAALALWDRRADSLVLHPAPAGSPAAAPELLERLGLPGSGEQDASAMVPTRIAVCWTWTACTTFHLLAFRVIETPEPVLPDAPYLVARPGHRDLNPLWPYLNDVEFVFACAFMAASLAALARRRGTA